MVTARRRSDRNREDYLEKDDAGNLFVTVAGSASSPVGTEFPVTVGSGYDGTVAELEVGATVAAAANNQTLAAAAGKRTYIQGFHIGGLGATAASVIAITITGLTNTLTYRFSVPAGATVIAGGMDIEFERPIPASADNTAIVVNVPSFGAGNTAADASARGFRL